MPSSLVALDNVAGSMNARREGPIENQARSNRNGEEQLMASVWGYEGQRTIVGGGGGGGMGAAVVRHLVDLGAEVHVLDLKEPPVAVASYESVDLPRPRGHGKGRRTHRGSR